MQFIIDFIRSSNNATSEYLLLQFIERNRPDFFDSLGENPSLFKKHFYLFHHLHKLRVNMVSSEHSLMISAVEIRICLKQKVDSQELSEACDLHDYYMNIENLTMTEQQIAEMLSEFWNKFYAVDKKAQAILLFGLQERENLDWTTIKKRFNQLAHQHHPDKGGNEEFFFELKQAYKVLKLIFNR